MNAKRISATLVALALLSQVIACTGRKPELSATRAGDTPVTESYRIGPGDRLRVFVWGNPGLSDEVPVRPDGRASRRRCSRTWSPRTRPRPSSRGRSSNN